jgi:anti-anti-sigma factor
MDLEIAVSERPEGMLVQPVGPLVTGTAPLLHERLLAILCRSPRTVILAMDEVVSLDAAGTSALVAINRRAGLMGTDLRFAEPRYEIARQIENEGLDRVFSMYPTIDAALKTEQPRKAG